MIDRLAPRPPAQGYTRIAVAQLHFNPAAVISEHSFLAQPFGLNEELLWGRVPPRPNFRDIAQRRKALGVQLRALYCDQITAKLATIARHCERWHCNLLVFPEYSVPPESIAAVIEASGTMATVLGTHYVEAPRARSTFYSDLGLSVTPEAGQAVALVSSNRVVVGSQRKMQRSRWEQDIHVSREWAPIQLAALGNRTLGVLICIDFLNERDEAFAQLVGPKLNETSVLAVPSLTSRASRSEFDPRLRSEAQRHGRAVAYANTASGGGTTIYIENANAQMPFPHGVPILDYGQEGVVVVDIDLDLNRPRDSRAARFDHRPVARSVAASQLIYLSDDVGSEYYACLNDVLADTGLNPLADAVKTHSERLSKSAATMGCHVADRIIDLIDKVDDIDDSERILCRLREVFMPREVLSPVALRALMLEGAERETSKWNGDPDVAKVVAEWRRQLQAARNEDL